MGVKYQNAKNDNSINNQKHKSEFETLKQYYNAKIGNMNMNNRKMNIIIKRKLAMNEYKNKIKEIENKHEMEMIKREYEYKNKIKEIENKYEIEIIKREYEFTINEIEIKKENEGMYLRGVDELSVDEKEKRRKMIQNSFGKKFGKLRDRDHDRKVKIKKKYDDDLKLIKKQYVFIFKKIT